MGKSPGFATQVLGELAEQFLVFHFPSQTPTASALPCLSSLYNQHYGVRSCV